MEKKEITTRVRIKKGVVDAGKEGYLYCVFKDKNGMRWAAVTFDGEEDPSLLKYFCLEIERRIWMDSEKL